MFCHKCGAQAIDGAKFCQKCGAKLIKDDEKQSPIETERAQTGEAIPLWESTPEPVQESAKTQNTSTETKSDSTKQPSPTVHTEIAQETDSFVEQMVASVFPPKTEKHVESKPSAEPEPNVESKQSAEWEQSKELEYLECVRRNQEKQNNYRAALGKRAPKIMCKRE